MEISNNKFFRRISNDSFEDCQTVNNLKEDCKTSKIDYHPHGEKPSAYSLAKIAILQIFVFCQLSFFINLDIPDL